MLAGRDIKAHRLPVVNHDPVGAAVDPSFVGIARDIEAAGPDVATPVVGVPFRRRKDGDINGLPGDHVLEHRAVVDVTRRDALEVGHVVLAECLAEFKLRKVKRKAESHPLASAGEKVDQHLAARERARNILENDAGGIFVVQDHLGGLADVGLPGQALHVAHFAKLARFLDPLPQVGVGDLWAEIRDGHGAEARFFGAADGVCQLR